MKKLARNMSELIIDSVYGWREDDYDDEGGKSMPYEPEEFGEAIDVAIEELSPEF